MTTTFDDMSIIRRYINATDGFDHASKRQDALSQRKSRKRGNRLAFYFHAVEMLQPEYDKHVSNTSLFNVKNMFEILAEAYKPRTK